MRILILATDYPSFLARLYTQNPGLNDCSFDEQSKRREDALFGFEGFYAQNFAALGHEARVLHPNNFHLQSAWAREHGMTVPQQSASRTNDGELVMWLKRRLRPYKALLGPVALRLSGVAPLSSFERSVLLAQIEEFKPDVILNQTIQSIDSSIIAAARRPGRFMIAQIGVDPPPGLDTGVYDLGISQIPWVVQYFRDRGLRAERHQVGFEQSVLDRLGPPPERDIDVSFVGGLGTAHSGRVAFLEAIARKYKLELWTPSLAGLPAGSPLHALRKGEVYGREMFQVLRRSRLTLNSHIDVARGSATNMRLFEATGVGTFLLTDNLRDLSELFAPGSEVATYDTTDDCLSKIRRYLDDDAEREAIASRGQSRTLESHTYRRRAEEILSLLARYGT